ncbi:GMC oxidoreductase [Streptantibioticus rubrisoli]|uniref:Cholesterol oxidase n=1 Tax=Streptantibioticus rubrisoli TaxID=1387313 RepID=A0ABT1PJ45_9ACTN|nr:GMC oxidoreductase [Streptantibioticus rubrisoli]MCQ4044523.1 GMC oxidoreductase [Streptantibioticus rubrisoli]
MEVQQHQADAVVVGSGYAGSIAALRLAEAGVDTLVLERGRRWPVSERGDTFTTQADPGGPDGRASWLSPSSPLTDKTLDVYTGVLESLDGDGLTMIAAAGVGGASLLSNATMVEPSAELFRQAFGDVLDHEEMTGTWYPQARELIGCSPIPKDVYDSDFYAAARSFADQLTRAGIPYELVDLAVDWDVIRAEMAGTRVAAEIAGLNLFGVNSGAQRSVDRTILARAEATGRVEVRPLSVVTAIRPAGNGHVVEYDTIDERGTVLARHHIATGNLVLAAGTLGTTRLLMRAKAAGALPDLPDALGTKVGNSEVITARTGMPENNPTQGGPSSILVKDWQDNPYAPVTLLNFPWPDAPSGQGWITTIGACPSPALGSFRYDSAKDDVVLSWPVDDPRVTRMASAVQDTLERLNTANPGSRTAFAKVGTTGGNVVGGVPLGIVTDDRGAVRGYRGLYVVDSSLLHGSSGSVPPALTVAAVAARVVSRLVPAVVRAR